MKYVGNLYGVWEWLFDSPKIQGEQNTGGKGEEKGLEKMRTTIEISQRTIAAVSRKRPFADERDEYKETQNMIIRREDKRCRESHVQS
jgi:hypothetical protein